MTLNKKTSLPFKDLNLVDLSILKDAVHLDNELILIDNLNLSGIDLNTSQFFTHYPVKLSFVIVIILFSGSMKFRINLENFEAKAQDIITVQKGTIGEFIYTAPESKIAVLAFNNEYFRMITHLDTAVELQQLTYHHPVNHFSKEVLQEALTIYHLMKNKIAETNNPFRKEILKGYMQAFMYNTANYLLSHTLQEPASANNDRPHEIHIRFIQAVQKYYMKERSVSFYANLLYITPKYLSQIVQKASGRFAGEWIAEYVILEAKALIKSRQYTIQQISDMLNFPNQSFFGRYFKKRVGLSPKEYQREK